jgi:hypothetical protein
MLPCFRFRLRSHIFPLVALVVLTLPPTGRAGSDASPDEARWKDGELRAPLPADAAKRAAAIEQAIAFGRSRGQLRPAGTPVTHVAPTTAPPSIRPAATSRPAPRRAPAAADPGSASWLRDLQERLRGAEQALDTPGAKSPASALEPEPVAIEAPAPIALPTTITFDGIDDTGWDPGAPDIAVGPEHIVLATTDRFAVMDKCGNTLLSELFRDFLILPPTRIYYTPKVVYDPWTPRWIMLYIGTENDYSNSVLYIAASHTADPLGQWSAWEIPTNAFFPGLKDSPAVAVTPDEVYITYNQFNLSTFAYEQVVMLELVKADVYAFNILTLFNRMGMTNPNDGSIAFSILPAQMRTFSGDMWFVNSVPFGDNFFTLWKLSGPPGVSSLIGYDVPTIPYTAPPDMTQPNATLVDAGECRFSDAVYASGKLYGTFARNNAGSPTVQIQQIDVVTLDDTGTFIGGADHKAYPTVDIDENDQVTFAYCITGAARFLSVAYNILAFPVVGIDAGVVMVGQANFSSGASPYRWGPYFGAALDPSDDRTVWIHGSYASNSPANSWTTRVGQATAFTEATLSVSSLTPVYVSGYEGGPFSPGQIDFELSNTGATNAVWTLSGVPSWLTAEALKGSLDPGATETISLFVNASANSLGAGDYFSIVTFSTCTGDGGASSPVELGVGLDGSCPGARITLAPPLPPTSSTSSGAPMEYGAFVTAIEDVNVCAIGIEADIDLPQNITATIYRADGTTRLASIASAITTAIEDASTVHYIPLSASLEACQEYDIAIGFGAGATIPYWDDSAPGLLPGDAGGMIRVRDAEIAGSAASTFLPRIVLIAEGGACANTTDLNAGAGAGVEATVGSGQGLFVSPERTVRLCSLGLDADLTPGTTLTARVYSVFGVSRVALLAEGTTVVTSPAFTFHDVPISQVLLSGGQYDLEIELEGTGVWWSYTTPPAVIPYSVDNTILVYGGEAAGVLTATLPHLRVGWNEMSPGAPFALVKPGDPYPSPTTSSGSLGHGAYITSLIDQEIYGIGVLADVPEGLPITAYVYEATGTTRGPLLSSGVVNSNAAGTQWHDVPLSASLSATGEYDIMFSAPGVTSWPYWLDTSGLPYDVYGTFRVRDAEAGGFIGTGFLAHMRVHACNPVLTAVGDGPQRAPMLLDPPAPNPATGMVRFGYSIDEAGEVDIAIYDARGARVADVSRLHRTGAGRDAAEFDTRKLASGVYFVRLTTRAKSTSRKFVVTH